uniref:Cytochrome P450 82C4 n=1 Tax=Anthurium amnicola TaxID=1678845 RepID=A0A1D1Z9I1_9ARAE
MDFPSQVGALMVGLLAIAFTSTWWVVIRAAMNKERTNRSREEAPQPRGGLPLIGHLHLLRNTVGGAPLPRTLAAMADRYGPVFLLRLGMRRALVVSSCGAASQCFSGANDRALASRPACAAAEHMGYRYAMFGFAPYGPYWRTVRKLVTVELLSGARVAASEHVRSSEVTASIRELYELWARSEGRRGGNPVVAVDVKQWFKNLSFSIIVRVVAGQKRHRSSSSDEDMVRLKQGIGHFFRLLGGFVASDYVPFLRRVEWGGQEKAMRSVAGDMDGVVAGWVEEHRRRRSAGKPGGDRDLDFMDVLLSAVEGPELADVDADTVVKATALAMMLGGNDTTSVSLTKNLAVLLNNPQVLRRAQEELDLHVGRHRNVQESDVKNLVYLQAVVKETFRLYPTAELSQPHEAMEDCEIAGFHVPAGTRLLTNIWKLQRDPAAWAPDPEEFRPDRFLPGSAHHHVDVKGRHFQLIPFGAGRRMCPGVSFALHVMHLTLARLLHSFELAAAPSAASGPVDMGDALFGPNPLEVALSPRLPPELYRMD